MRKFLGLAALGLAALTAGTSQAQTLSAFTGSMGSASTFGGSASQAVVNTPVDTSLAIAPFPAQGQSGGFLSNIFHSISLPSFPPLTGSSPLPPPSAFPSTQYQNFQAVPFTPANNLPRFLPPPFNQ